MSGRRRSAPRHRTAAALLLAAVLGAAAQLPLLLGGATAAAAHDVLESTTPSDGASVAVTPGQVTLTFDQPAFAVGSQVLVDGPGGNVAQGPLRIVDRVVTQAIRPGAAAGRYTVEWRVTSADGHPVSGKFGFTSAAASRASATPLPSGTSTTTSTVPTSAASSTSANAWVLPVLVLAALWVVVVVFAVRHKQRSITPKVDKDKRRRRPGGRIR